MNYFFIFIGLFFYFFLPLQSTSTIQLNKNNDPNKTVQSAITYELNGGRFGDNLLSYARAKWLSYQYNLPLMIYPFPYSDQLKLNDYERKICMDGFTQIVKLIKPHDCINQKYNTLYINHWGVKVPINWNDQTFIKELQLMIAPRYPLNLITIPEGVLSVAVHVRKGGGFSADTQQEKDRCPLRFVSDEFFIDQIDRLAQLFKGQKLYVYLFTDDPNPEKLASKFSHALNNSAITFDYRQKDNSHNANVLEDFFSMMQFDCLIRPGSHFSRFVERLGKAHTVIYPEDYRKKTDGTTIINVIGIKKRTPHGWKTTKITIA